MSNLVMASLLLAVFTGCAENIVHTIPVMRADLPKTEPLIQTLNVQEAYYWIDAEDQVNLSLRFHYDSPLGPALSAEWLMSLLLDKLPAGRERLYHLATNELRMIQIRGLSRLRGRSFSGIVILEAPKHDRLDVRFHATVQQQVFSALTGWSGYRGGPVVTLVGKCVAIMNASKGEPIRERTEADGMERVRRAPTTTPAAP